MTVAPLPTPGSVSFGRGPNRRVAPPDGGNGGNGGSVMLRCDAVQGDLALGRHRFGAGHGGHGRGRLLQGRNGHDLVVPVPCGTTVRVFEPSIGGVPGELANKMLLQNLGDHAVVAVGG